MPRRRIWPRSTYGSGRCHLESNLRRLDTPESRLVAELARTGHPELSSLRTSLALGAYLQGRVSLAEARELTGAPEQGLDRLVLGGLDRDDCRPEQGPSRPGAQVPLLSVVIPVHNEQGNLAVLHERLAAVLELAGSHEIVFVDDGSTDRSAAIIIGLHERDSSVALLCLSRNFGHQAALSAGLDHARGQAVVLMDADLQDPPELLPEFVQHWREGYEIVYAVRANRKEGLLKRACYFAFYRTFRLISPIEIPLDSGDFCLLDRRVADTLAALPERNRFLRGLRAWTGFRQLAVPYDRPARLSGRPAYSFARLVKLALDGLLAFSSVPLRLASYFGFLTAAAGVAYVLVALYARIFVGRVPAGWTSIIAIVLVVGGIQLILTGVLGAYLARVYDEAKHRPLYIVDRAYGAQTGASPGGHQPPAPIRGHRG